MGTRLTMRMTTWQRFVRPHVLVLAVILVVPMMVPSTPSAAAAAPTHQTGYIEPMIGSVAPGSPVGRASRGDGLVAADPFTGTAGPPVEGQIEVAALSTRASTVTGGDVVVGIRGVARDDTVTVTANGRDVTARFTAEADPFGAATLHAVGLVDGLRLGRNRITAVADGATHGRRSATLPVTNHPTTGPVFSGPHQEPFTCRVHDLDDYAPGSDATPDVLDEDCSIETYVRWYYLSEAPSADEPPVDPADPRMPDQVPGDAHDWVELTDPYEPYPPNMATTVTTDGEVVPAIARVETSTINRGITRVAVLDDPAARGPDAPFEVAGSWNRRVVHNWGASCGIGRQQGINSPNEVLSGGIDAGGEALDVGPEVFRPAVLQGYLTAHSSLTAFGTHCNQVLSAETFMMVREHLTEAYGRHEWVMGNGASGGAIQQYTTMNMYPGLLDGGLPLVSFPDVVTTAMSPVDCRLLRQVFQLANGPNPTVGGDRELWTGRRWTVEQQNAITGHATPGICEDWDAMFADLVVADRGCGRIPVELRYSRETRSGERCTLQDNLRHYLGVGDEGYAPIPVDNVGVQYGLQALLDEVISVDDFLELNRLVGGLDDEGYGPWDPDAREQHDPAEPTVQPRMSMAPDLAKKLYGHGFVTGRGALDQAPIIDVNLYVDPVPVLGFHDQVRGYMAADRIEQAYGRRETHAIWSGVVFTNDAWSTMHAWLDGLEDQRAAAGGASNSWTEAVVASRPPQGEDACVVTTAGYAPVPLAAPGTAGQPDMPCEQVFRVGASPRIAAGGPRTEDVLKCRLTAPDPADYPAVKFTSEQWAELTRIFPDGVCDFSVPGVGEVERSQTWLSWGTDAEPLDEPEPITHFVARSASPADHRGAS